MRKLSTLAVATALAISADPAFARSGHGTAAGFSLLHGGSGSVAAPDLPRLGKGPSPMLLTEAAGSSPVRVVERHDYTVVDSVALNVPAAVETDMEALVRHLVAPAKNDREKARAIYRWVTDNIEYDTESFFSGKPAPAGTDPFETRKAVCEGYSNVFERLARLAGLQVVSIEGYGKGYGYKPGQRFKRKNHAWNAVKIDGEWHLIDTTWGAGPVDGTRFIRDFEDYWFLTPPEEFIYTHYPLDRKWQLQRKRLSKKQWEGQLYVSHPYFKVGFSADSLRAYSARKGFPGLPEAFAPPSGRVAVLTAPMGGALEAGATSLFRIAAPGAAQVVVVSGGKWYPLERSGSVHEGAVRNEPGELVVQVKFAERDPFAVFLVYQVGAAD